MIYFDHAATTPTEGEVTKLFFETNQRYFANPSSSHPLGREASVLLENARSAMLKQLGLEKTHDLLFTSGATESNNLAIKGVALHYQNRGKRILTSAVEHPSVLNAFKELEPLGFQVVILPVNEKGQVSPETLKNAMDKETILVSIMAVNNEVGSINDIVALSQIVHAYPKAYFHTDATQAMGKMALPYGSADLISFSAHKFGALKGCGGLYYKRSIAFEALNSGGEQERGFRSGTVNMPADVSMAKALEISYAKMASHEKSVRYLQGYLRENLAKRDDVEINSPADGAPYILNFSLRKKKASVVLEALAEREIYVSSVSACSSKGEPVSYVLEAMGKSEEEARNSIRLSFSYLNTIEEAETFLIAFDEIMSEVHDR
jgi:cysteine desulfurase